MWLLTTSSGYRLSYILTIKDYSSKEIVLIIHGTFCTKNTNPYPYLSEELSFNSLRFDLEGNGDSEGTFKYSSYVKEAEMIHDAVAWCNAQGFEVVALIGHSKGANEVLIYSALYKDVPNIISLAARIDTTTLSATILQSYDIIQAKGEGFVYWGGKEFRVTLDEIKEKVELDMKIYLREITTSNVMIIHGDADQIIPVSEALEIREIIGEATKEYLIIPGADHFFEGHEKELAERIGLFIKANR